MDFIVIPSVDLIKRLVRKTRNPDTDHRIFVVFWLLDDRFLYDCTLKGAEWEYYFLSRGVNGRMVDDSEWDYSMFLNDWNRLKKVQDTVF